LVGHDLLKTASPKDAEVSHCASRGQHRTEFKGKRSIASARVSLGRMETIPQKIADRTCEKLMGGVAAVRLYRRFGRDCSLKPASGKSVLLFCRSEMWSRARIARAIGIETNNG